MIKTTRVGTLKATGDFVFQQDVGSMRIFKTITGKEVTISEIEFFDGPVQPMNALSVVQPVTKETPEQEEASAATVAIMEEANENLGE